MLILLYILAGLSLIMGSLILVAAYEYDFIHLGLTLGGLSYIIGGLLTIKLFSWWPLIGGWLATFVIRKVFDDPTKN